MIPRVTQGGRSFKGAFQYYMQDRGADTRERISWTHTHNMMTDDPDKAWRVMAYTAMHQDRLKEASGQKATGRKVEKPVLAYSLSWHPDQCPDKDHMLKAAMDSLETLGLKDHEAVVIAHTDTHHPHVHIVANRIHPITGLVASNSNSFRKLSKFALEYQRQHNIKRCPKREENHAKRQEGKATQYGDPRIQKAWNSSDNGKSFVAALEQQGYRLAQGRKRLVVVDPYGKVHNPVRHLESIKTKAFKERLDDLDPATLPEATEFAKAAAAKHEALKVERLSPKKSFEAKVSLKNEATQQHENQNAESATLNRLQYRHIKERAEISLLLNRQIASESEKLSSYYKIKEQRTAILRLQKKCDNPSIWRKLFGLARKDREELHLHKLTYQNAKMRFNERIGTLKNEYTKRTNKLEERQKHEIERTRKHLHNRSTDQARCSSREYDSRLNRGLSREPT